MYSKACTRAKTYTAKPIATVDVSAVARRIAADLAQVALQQRQTLELDAPTPCMVQGNDLLVGVLLRNLIDNASRYSPAGARILVTVATSDGQVTVCIEDSAPGMSDRGPDWESAFTACWATTNPAAVWAGQL